MKDRGARCRVEYHPNDIESGDYMCAVKDAESTYSCEITYTSKVLTDEALALK